MKKHTQLFVLGTLYAIMELCFLAVSVLVDRQIDTSPYPGPTATAVCLTLVAAGIAAYGAYTTFLKAATARQAVLQV